MSQGPIAESANLGEKFASNSFALICSCLFHRVHDSKHLLNFTFSELLAFFFSSLLRRSCEVSTSAPEADDVLSLLTVNFPMEDK